jgi:SNF2 family DNA or RNA helicase
MQSKLETFFGKTRKSTKAIILPKIEVPDIDLSQVSDRPTDIETLTKNNELALQLIEAGQIDKKAINYLFNGKGVEYENTEGLKGIYKKRMETLQQYFTPTGVSKLIVKILQIPYYATVLDNTCGSGRMFYAIPNKKLITGIEFEEKAYLVAKVLYRQAQIIRDNAVYHYFENNFDYVLINPPFNIQWYVPHLTNIGYKGAILSHLACLEIGIKALKPDGYLVAILPANTFKLDSTIKFHTWLNTQAQMVLRIELPRKVFLRANYPSTLFVFKKTTRDLDYELQTHKLESLEDLEELYTTITEYWNGNKDIQTYSKTRMSYNPIKIKPFKRAKIRRKEKILPLTETDEITVGHSGNSLSLKPNGLIASLKIQNIFARFNKHKWNPELKCYINEVSHFKSLDPIWSSEIKSLTDHPIIRELQTMNVKLIIKPELEKYIAKKRRWFRKQTVPFEQWVRPSNSEDWREIYAEDGIRTVLAQDYKLAKRKLNSLRDKYPFIDTLYEYQFDDVIRLSLKDSALDASKMGLGKTRKAITLALLRNVKHTLIVLPTYLIHSWMKEFKKLNKYLSRENRLKIKIIKDEWDCSNLKQFNIISYHTLSLKKWRKRPNITFADKINRRFKFIIADEAQNFSKKTSKRTRAIRKLKAKYWLFLTGTPIGNMVKGFWSLADILFKAQTPRFPYSTSDFRKAFVTVSMVTSQFDETLCKGKTSQQLPTIKDLQQFQELVKYMWLRRLKKEPEVRKDVQIVDPIIKTKTFTPNKEHLRMYKKHLDHFAELFIKYLHPELHEHDKVKAAVVLAQMGNLQFVSTIPQHERFEIFEDEYQYHGKLTVIQDELLKILEENYAAEKILVISQRPDFCSFMQKKLRRKGIQSGLFTGQRTVAQRNELLDRFDESDKLNILLCTINTVSVGLNIPKGTMVIIVDLDWTYQKLEQAYSRVLRPETKESPTVLILFYKGFIDSYLWQHIRAKKSAILSGVDHREDLGYELD